MLRFVVALPLLAACPGGAPATRLAGGDAEAPTVVIASPDSGDLAFDRIGAVVPVDDSTVAISLPSSRRFIFYNTAGHLTRVVGRQGSGPGELSAVAASGVLADSLWVYDPVADRVTLFDIRTGRLVATRRAGLHLAGWPASASVLGLLQDGSLLVEGRTSITGLAHRTTPGIVPVARVTADGRLLQAVGARDLSGWAFAAKAGAGEIQGIQPFARIDWVAAASDGSGFALVSQDEAAVTVTMFDATGATRYHRPLPLVGDLLTGARTDSALGHLGPPFGGLADGVLAHPDRLPAVSDAILGTDGSLWLLVDPPVLGRLGARWAVLSPNGASLDTVGMPTARRLARPMAAAYWAVEMDSLDVPRVVQYPRRGSPGSVDRR